VPFEPPRSLSPSKVNTFTDCALAFRFTAIDRLPEMPSVWTVKGTLVHRALERLFWYHPQGGRSPAAAMAELARAWDELQSDPEFALLGLGPDEAEAFRLDAAMLVEHYFELEDPDAVLTVGVEITLDAMIGGVRLRGIIDRLDLDADGELVVVDYKTGRAPAPSYERSKLTGVHLYALLCEEVLGRPPAQVRLLHLREPLSLIAEPSEQALRGHRAKTGAVWSAIERACRDEDFRPRPSSLCNYCRFREFCPAFGGDPSQAAVVLGGAEAPPVESGVEAVA
jgi:putative RecB family exonuclease